MSAVKTVLGHEIFGEVVAVGPDAQDVAVGDRRVVYPWIGCGECAVCQRGEEHLCTPGRGSGHCGCRRFRHTCADTPQSLLVRQRSCAGRAGSHLCLFGLTAYGAIKKLGKLNPADEVVIIGAGGVGMMAIQIARALGIDPIVVDMTRRNLKQPNSWV